MVWGGLGCFRVVWGVSTDRKIFTIFVRSVPVEFP